MALIDIPAIDALKSLYESREVTSDETPIQHRLLFLSSVSSDGVLNTMPFGAWKEILDPGGWRFIAYIVPSNYTHELMMQTGVFTISVPPQHMYQKA